MLQLIIGMERHGEYRIAVCEPCRNAEGAVSHQPRQVMIRVYDARVLSGEKLTILACHGPTVSRYDMIENVCGHEGQVPQHLNVVLFPRKWGRNVSCGGDRGSDSGEDPHATRPA